MKKDMKKIIRTAQDQGFRVVTLKSGHLKFLAPDGVSLAVVASTPSDVRAFNNAKADLRRAGLRL